MIKKYVIFIVVISFCLTIYCQNSKHNNIYYRSGIVIVDTLLLPNGSLLLKNEYVQIIQNKSTEEGTFIKCPKGSGKVYYKDIKTLCWLKRKLEVKPIEADTLFNFKKNTKFIFDGIEGDSLIVNYNGYKFRIRKDNIYFDNKNFFYRILN